MKKRYPTLSEKTVSAFTLIELLIVITIMIIMSLMVYAPYNHYQVKQKVRNSAKLVSQTLYEARNLAINGVESSSGNLSIGLHIGGLKKEELTFYAYPYEDHINGAISNYEDASYIYQKVQLEPGVKITEVGGEEGGLFLYTAISGSGGYYYYDGGIKKEFTDSTLDINLGFQGAATGSLTKKIQYYTRTYVSDVSR